MHIAQPLTLKSGLVLKNLLVKAAMTEGLADQQDRVTVRNERLYARWASGGVAMQITGNVMIDEHYLERTGNIVIEDESGVCV